MKKRNKNIDDNKLMSMGFKALQKFIKIHYKGEIDLKIIEGNKHAFNVFSKLTTLILAPPFQLKGEKEKKYIKSECIFSHQFMPIGESQEYYEICAFQLLMIWLLKSKIKFNY